MKLKNPLIHKLCIKGRISRGSTLIDRKVSRPLIEGVNLYAEHAGYRFTTITESPFPIKGHSKPVFRQFRCKAITPVSMPLSGQFPLSYSSSHRILYYLFYALIIAPENDLSSLRLNCYESL